MPSVQTTRRFQVTVALFASYPDGGQGPMHRVPAFRPKVNIRQIGIVVGDELGVIIRLAARGVVEIAVDERGRVSLLGGM